MEIIDRVAICQDTGHKIRKSPYEGEVIHRLRIDGAHDAASIARFFRMYAPVGNKMPYTYLVWPDGRVEQSLEHWAIGWHAKRYSRTRIGVAVIGDFRKHEPTPEQYDALVELLVKLSRERGAIDFYGHDQLDGGSADEEKKCPGALLPIDKLRSDVRLFMLKNAINLLGDTE